MNPFVMLSAMGAVPVIASVILYLTVRGDRKNPRIYMKQQLLYGLIFGAIAICGTEFGVPYSGAVINARDAAPLCAGLIFGSEAGVIAGLIGGFERGIAVAWGAGYYTRFACTVSTCLAGMIAGWLRMTLFENKRPQWHHALAVAAVVETIHMLMIFVTNTSDVKRAFTYVTACTIPMITVVSVSVALAVFLVNQLSSVRHQAEEKTKPTISAQFQKNLIIIVTLFFGATTSFTWFLQNQISTDNTRELLRLSLEDVVSDVQDQCDETLLLVNRLVASELATDPDADLEVLKNRYNVCEINVIDRNAYIIASTNPEYIGFDMARGGMQSTAFLTLLREGGMEELVQGFMPTSRDRNVYRKYSGVRTEGGFVQVAFDGVQMTDEISTLLYNVVSNRHIGENGFLIILDHGEQVISSTTNAVIDINGDAEGEINLDPEGTKAYTMYKAKFRTTEYYYMFTTAESYYIVGMLPMEEADFSKNLSTYLNVFSMAVIFGVLVVCIFLILKYLVVENIRSINRSLAEITAGNLDTVVDVRDNREFDSLSDGINSTVDTLKRYIAEANKRIDRELKYAREIQSSALPSHFPAFPDHDEFDIYALMDPAKEVGGDFYDFYFVGDDTLVFLVADVSGKGIPASLFMMRAKTTLKSYAENNIAPEDIFTNANYHLCEGNDTGMFVTAWMGFLNLKTGEMRYVNAGHNDPVIRRKDGSYEFLKGERGFVLGGMEGMMYKEERTVLGEGDAVFLYTDGVVEATNKANEMYGNDRLKACLDAHADEDAKAICQAVREDVDVFYDGGEQFDDITELSLQLKKYSTM